MLVQDLHKAVQEGLQRTTSNKMNIKTLLENTPRLRDWYEIGPVQRAELEQFAQLLLDSQHTAITADGVLVEPNTQVYVLSSTGKIEQTRVLPTKAVTDYCLFDNIPVSSSFSSRSAAQTYKNTAQ